MKGQIQIHQAPAAFLGDAQGAGQAFQFPVEGVPRFGRGRAHAGPGKFDPLAARQVQFKVLLVAHVDGGDADALAGARPVAGLQHVDGVEHGPIGAVAGPQAGLGAAADHGQIAAAHLDGKHPAVAVHAARSPAPQAGQGDAFGDLHGHGVRQLAAHDDGFHLGLLLQELRLGAGQA